MKVLIVGDSPFLKTGFGRINSIAAAAFAEAGYDVGVVSGLSMDPVADSLGYTMYYPEQGDVIGNLAANKAVYDFEPDLVYHTGEPGTLTAFARTIPARIPFMAYSPIEGEPIVLSEWKAILAGMPGLITCSNYGVEVLKKYTGRDDVPMVYHGIDHDVFKVNGRRDEVRHMLGWDDRFVVMTVATNVRRKQHPRLFEAIAILRQHYKQDDIILYDHTVPFDSHWLDGWNLPEIAHNFGILDAVRFNPSVTKANDFVPEVGQYEGIGLVDLYNAADLFVLPSQVEGFGLPIAEAMACGVPVAVTKYAAGWEVARDAGVGLPVKDWEVHKSGTRYANVDVEAMASEILRLKRNPRERARRSALGLQRVRDFRWENFTETLIPYAKTVIERHAAQSYQAQEPQDTNQNEGRQEGTGANASGTSAPADSLPSSEVDRPTGSEEVAHRESPGLPTTPQTPSETAAARSI